MPKIKMDNILRNNVGDFILKSSSSLFVAFSHIWGDKISANNKRIMLEIKSAKTYRKAKIAPYSKAENDDVITLLKSKTII